MRPPAITTVAHIPPPPRVPCPERLMADALAVRVASVAATWGRRVERAEAATQRPGGVR